MTRLTSPSMGEVVESAILAVALPRGIDERQVARFAVPVGASPWLAR